MNQVVVCAAIRIRGEIDVVGVRHWDVFMHKTIKSLLECGKITRDDLANAEQGFVDQRGYFLTREEAWELASENDQIRRTGPGFDGSNGKLFSENLY